jgi:hypothetical protein
LAVAVPAGALLFDRLLMPGRAPVFHNPSVLDVVVDSRLMVGLARLSALVVAGYVLLSVAARVRRGQWLSAVGPFTVDESVQGSTAENNELRTDLDVAKETIDAQAEIIERLVASRSMPRFTVDHEPGGVIVD